MRKIVGQISEKEGPRKHRSAACRWPSRMRTYMLRSQALRVIDQHVNDYVTRARMPKAA
jgi:hypothetical protein